MDSDIKTDQTTSPKTRIKEPSTLVLPPRRKITELFSTYKTSFSLFLLLLMVLAIPITLKLSSKQQDVRQRAASTSEQIVSVDAIATASNSYPNFGPANVINLSNSAWNSGGYAPQWIRLELSQTQTISSIRLKVAQYPPGVTTTNIYAGNDPNNLPSVKQLNQNTSNGDELNVSFPNPIPNVKYIKIEMI